MNVLSLAAGVLPEFQPEDVAEAGARAGYQHVGFTIEPDGWTDTRTRALVARVRELGLQVLDVEVIWIPEDGQLTEQDRLIVEVGAELGASNVLTVSRSDDVNINAAALHQLCEWAEPAGMRVCLEFLMIAAVRSFDQARTDRLMIRIVSEVVPLVGIGLQIVELVPPILMPVDQLPIAQAHGAVRELVVGMGKVPHKRSLAHIDVFPAQQWRLADRLSHS